MCQCAASRTHVVGEDAIDVDQGGLTETVVGVLQRGQRNPARACVAVRPPLLGLH
jgi:hypothetical protein